MDKRDWEALLEQALKPEGLEEAALKALLENPFWPEGLAERKRYYRNEDMGRGGISVMLDQDGDTHIAVAQDGRISFAEFCTMTGGGRSPRVRAALVYLALAIKLDEEERP
jgi:hypothetical protein